MKYEAYLHRYDPTDETRKSELDRLDLTHQMLRVTMRNTLHFAPVDGKFARILDVGTGTGIWAIEMADDYPDAEIIGIDLSATQPSWYSTCRYEASITYANDSGFLQT